MQIERVVWARNRGGIMKSLEIVNEMIEDLKSRLESANYLANGNPSWFGKQVISDLEK